MKKSYGIHHISALASDPKRIVDFYTKVLGLRMVKKSVNQDDVETYHLYFANRSGEPGTVMTYFPHPNSRQGMAGKGLATEVRFEIPKAAMAFWLNRLHEHGVQVETPRIHFGETHLRFSDPDGLTLELVGTGYDSEGDLWVSDEISAEHAIRGFHSATIWAGDPDKTIALLKDTFGFHVEARENNRIRLSTGQSGIGQVIEVLHQPDLNMKRGVMGAGTVHHIAFRAGSDEHEVAMRSELEAQGYHLTPVIDRYYFHSVYFREPSGVIFEIATDEPGFAVDEDLDQLGTSLKLPPFLEDQRARIEAALPPIE